jgi:threonylcarbamoyladenosine tRNA methylthiotransferase MtaB
MKAAIYTLGCKVNQYDSNGIAACLIQNGYELTDSNEDADVYIINTCAVTNESERKSRQMIRKLKHLHPDSIIVVTGCFSETNENAVKRIAEADIVTGTHNRMQIPALIEEYKACGAQIARIENTDEAVLLHLTKENRMRAVLKIQDGCNRYCSYCIIPYARGPLWSADADAVIDAIRLLREEDCKEVVLTGIHLASYRDKNDTSLIDLMERIDAETDLPRLRLGSLEPKLLDQNFLDRLKILHCFCPHFLFLCKAELTQCFDE